MSVVELFPKKLSAIPEGETMEQTVVRFHEKLDIALSEFGTMSVMEKWELFETVVGMNKNIFKLYMDVKKQRDFDIKWYADLSDKLARAIEKNEEMGIE